MSSRTVMLGVLSAVALCGLASPAEAFEPSTFASSAMVKELGLNKVAVDDAYHGDRFETWAPKGNDAFARGVSLTYLWARDATSFFTLYIARPLIDSREPRAMKALILAAGLCPAWPERAELLRALRSGARGQIAEVLAGKRNMWGKSGTSDAWLLLKNSSEQTPLIVGGVTRDPPGVTLRLECRG